MFKTPKTITWDFMRYFALPHLVGIVAEVGTWVCLLFVTNGRIGPHPALVALFPYYIYHLVAWPFQPRENGKLPSCLPWNAQCLVIPVVLYVSQTERTSQSHSLSLVLSLSRSLALSHTACDQRLSAPRFTFRASCMSLSTPPPHALRVYQPLLTETQSSATGVTHYHGVRFYFTRCIRPGTVGTNDYYGLGAACVCLRVTDGSARIVCSVFGDRGTQNRAVTFRNRCNALPIGYHHGANAQRNANRYPFQELGRDWCGLGRCGPLSHCTS